jgi:penicillin-binding protein 1A
VTEEQRPDDKGPLDEGLVPENGNGNGEPPAEAADAIQSHQRRSHRFVLRVLYGLVLAAFIGMGILFGLYLSLAIDLPEVEALEDYQPSVVTEIYSDDNTPIGQFYLERRKLVSPNEIPLYFKQAVISIEDKSYYSHFGIDLKRIFTSSLINLAHLRVVRGASTITQQLSKLLFLTPEQSYERKIKEAILAIQIERHYSKDRIFTFYANKINLAHGNYGIASAAEFYFRKPLKELTLSECALLAAIIKRPMRYSPLINPKLAVQRRNLVLSEMCRDGYITKAQMKAAQKEPLVIVGKELDKNFAGYFVEMIRLHLQRNFSNRQIFTEGLKVYTTLNHGLQENAEQSIREGLRSFDRRKGWRDNLPNVLKEDPAARLETYKHPDWRDKPEENGVMVGLVMDVGPAEARIRIGDYSAVLKPDGVPWIRRKTLEQFVRRGDLAQFRILKINEAQKKLEVRLEQQPEIQGALLTIENKTGAIKAMVGGFDWEQSKFNRAVQAKRQTGSIFKPFVYTTAIQAGMSPDDTVLDEPLTIVSDIGVEYTPMNYDEEFRGPITLRRALAESINIPAVRVGMQVGIPAVIQTARKFGLTSELYPYPSTALGACEVTLLEMVSAFSTFPDDGYRMEPYFISRIEDYRGNVLEEHHTRIHEVIPAQVSRTMVSMLRGVVQFGTSQKAKALKVEIGGKTGTTNDFTDAWFIGFTPSITTGVWVGYDEKKSLGDKQTGSEVALPIWIDYMSHYVQNHLDEHFPADTSPYMSEPTLPPATESVGARKKIIEEDLD